MNNKNEYNHFNSNVNALLLEATKKNKNQMKINRKTRPLSLNFLIFGEMKIIEDIEQGGL